MIKRCVVAIASWYRQKYTQTLYVSDIDNKHLRFNLYGKYDHEDCLFIREN